MNPVIYTFGDEFKGTKEQCIQWLGEHNINQATEKIFLLDPELRQDFRPYMLKRAKEHLFARG